MEPEKAGDAPGPLQRWYIHVQAHSVDTLDLQSYVLLDNLSDRPCYAHLGSG